MPCQGYAIINEIFLYLLRWLQHANLTGLRFAQISGKTLYLRVSLKVIMEENSIWSDRLCNEDYRHQRCWEISNLLRSLIDKQEENGKICSLCLSWDTHLLPIRHWYCGFQAFKLGLWLKLLAPCFSGLHIQTELYHWRSWISTL